MKTEHEEKLYIKQDELTDLLFDQKSILFDIETTGFSPAHSQLYLIGCARRQGNYLCIDQFFAENASEEKMILNAFLEILKAHTTIISFNGIGFDIPYLKAKCSDFKLKEDFRNYQYLDIYKTVSGMKFLFRLKNYKQKTLEQFLGVKREDKYTGGELINVYLEYQKSQKEDSCSLLMLHNYEDILGMMDLLPVFSYSEIFQGQFQIAKAEVNRFQNYEKQMEKELLITLKGNFVVPKAVSCRNHGIYLNIHGDRTILRVPVLESELHYYYPDYENYYYLPEEDIAVHKSVSSYVDKEHRQKAKADNCYNRKQGEFLPQYQEVIKPAFRKERKDKISYFELTEDFRTSDVMLRRYVEHLLIILSRR